MSLLSLLPPESTLSDIASELSLRFRTGAIASNKSIITNIANRLTRAAATRVSPSASLGSSSGPILEDVTGIASVFDTVVGVPAEAAEFATVARNGKRIDNGRTFGASQLKWTSSDGKSDGRGATVVTFAFDEDFDISGVSNDRAKTLFAEALQTWANYAPLDFKEVKDPGSGSRVDILAQTEKIDGRSGTLAFAYFPSVGDITFDKDEAWSESMFLETTVHELGHSLGLDHENDFRAIMNSVLKNRFSDEAFLLQDDINGIQSLYGKGKGTVTRLNGTKTVAKKSAEPNLSPSEEDAITPLPATNLITNGSFEDVPVQVGESGKYEAIKGWSTISGPGFLVDRRPATAGKAADGTAWLELDISHGQNSTIGQNIDTITGQTYNVSVDFSDGGRPESTTSIHVFWEGQQVDTLSGGGKGQWRRFDYALKGGDRDVSTLAFRAIGPSDKVGGFIDNVVVTAAKASLNEAMAAEESGQKLGFSSQPAFHNDPISHGHAHHDHDHHDHYGHSPLVAASPFSNTGSDTAALGFG